MRTTFILIFLTFSVVETYAQFYDWAWAKNAGGISNEYGNAICTDANGYVYFTGTFQGSLVTFGNNILSNTATSSLDIFIVKCDPNGNVIWAKSVGGTRNDWAYDICADANGNVYITGYFQSPTITFGTTILNHDDTTGFTRNIFVAKYDANGNPLWAKKASGHAMSYGICVDTDNSVYITGGFGYSTNISFGSTTLVNRGGYDVFIAKYDTDGNLLWAKNEGGAEIEDGIAICTDATNNIYITGYFQDSAIFGNDTLTANSNTGIYTAKYDSYGNFIWAKSAIGLPSGSYNYSNGITASAGGVYITGSFESSIIMGDTLGNTGTNSIFIAKYDSDNGNPLWGRSPGGTGYDYARGITSDLQGNVFLTGDFKSSFLNFGNIPVLNANVGYEDVFIAKYDSNGNALWATGIGGQDRDIGMAISVNSTGDVFTTGYLSSHSNTFGNITVTNNGSYDVFYAKLSSDTTSTGVSLNSSSVAKIFPNPFSTQLTFVIVENEPITALLYNFLGQQVLQQTFTNSTTISTEQLANGIYLYELRNTNGILKTGKVIKQ